jgi:hypothetical protein
LRLEKPLLRLLSGGEFLAPFTSLLLVKLKDAMDGPTVKAD